MTRVYTAKDPPDAHLVVAYLAAHGIEAEVEGEALWSAQGDLPIGPASAPHVVVEDTDAETARELIAKRPAHRHCAKCGYDLTGLTEARCPECATPFVLPDGPAGPAWSCSACGEEIEGQFTACWNCGAERTS